MGKYLKMRLFLSLLSVSILLYSVELDYAIENINIITKTGDETKDYNRLRVDLVFEDERYENSIVKIIADNENFYNKTANNSDNNSLIYRGYFKYTDEKHLLSVGLQRIPFGVGRIWNPIDIFNPIDSTAIETAQRKGTDSIRYEYAVSDLSNIDATYSKEKSAFRIKGYLDVADAAIIVLNDKKQDQNIIGYELEGEFLSSGIELRSEGGYFKDKNLNDSFYKYILGAEYGFENSLSVLGEYYYDSENKMENMGINITYTITPLLNVNLLNLINTKDNSYFLSSTLQYNLADDIILEYGYLSYHGNSSSQYGDYKNSHFLKLFVSF